MSSSWTAGPMYHLALAFYHFIRQIKLSIIDGITCAVGLLAHANQLP